MDTGIFYRKNVRPGSLSGVIGYFLNLTVFTFYWLYSAIQKKDIRELKGISGFLEGFFGKT
jgi:hypothetical protein